MKGSLIVLGIVVSCLAVGPPSSAADLTGGTWKLNEAKSRHSASAQSRYETVTIEATGDSMKVTLDGTDSAGKKVHAQWTGKYDGKDYPVTGSPDIDSLSYKKIDDHHYEGVTKQAGKTMTSAKIVYSADGKTRTVTLSGTNSKGEKVTQTSVYQKQ